MLAAMAISNVCTHFSSQVGFHVRSQHLVFCPRLVMLGGAEPSTVLGSLPLLQMLSPQTRASS